VLATVVRAEADRDCTFKPKNSNKRLVRPRVRVRARVTFKPKNSDKRLVRPQAAPALG
jgi:hypothetical protein